MGLKLSVELRVELSGERVRLSGRVVPSMAGRIRV